MSLMKAHVRYSQGLATRFKHLMQDYEEFVQSDQRNKESPPEVNANDQERAQIEEARIKSEPIQILDGLSSDRVEENANKPVGHEVVMIEALIEAELIEKVRHLRPRRTKKNTNKAKKAVVQDKTVLKIETLKDEPGQVLLEFGTEREEENAEEEGKAMVQAEERFDY